MRFSLSVREARVLAAVEPPSLTLVPAAVLDLLATIFVALVAGILLTVPAGFVRSARARRSGAGGRWEEVHDAAD
jgi:uncharacterized integral membrane protein